IAVLGIDVNASEVECAVQEGCVRLGLGYIKGVASSQICELVAERERNGPFRSFGELAGRSALGRSTLEQLAWSGACEGLRDAPAHHAHHAHPAGHAHPDRAARRTALWQLGMAAPGVEAADGTQLALPLEQPP